MKNKIFLLLGIILLIGFVSADFGIFKQDECVQIRTISNSTQVNISSLSYPDSTIAITEAPMTKVGYTFNYTFCNTSDLGTYIYDYHDELGNVYVNSFEITPSGFANTLGFFIMILLLSFGIIIFGFTAEDSIITLLGSFGLYFLGLYILFNGIADIRNLTTTWAIGLITLGLAFYVSGRSAYELITSAE